MMTTRSMRGAFVSAALIAAAAGIAAPAFAGDFKEAQKEWKDALKSGDRELIAAAAAGLGASEDKKAVGLLLDAGAKVPDQRVYGATVDALAELARSGGEAAEEVRKKASRASDPRQQMACIDALAKVDDAESAAALAAALDDGVQAVRVAAIRALGALERKESVEPLIAHLEKVEKKGGQEVVECRTALTKITGAEFTVAADWRNFWEPRKESFDPKNEKSNEKGGVKAETLERNPKLFGSEILSKRLVLVLDVSNSMRVIDPGAPPSGGETLPGTPGGGAGGGAGGAGRDPGIGWPPDPNSRFMRARNELIQFIGELDKDVAFNLIVFADKVTAWQEGKLLPAKKPVKAQAIEWVKSIQWGPATRTDLALEKAFTVQGADTIYLLSDGNPEQLGNVPIAQDEILKKVGEMNRFRRVQLNTMGFPGQHRAFLEKLAAENNGTYKDIR